MGDQCSCPSQLQEGKAKFCLFQVICFKTSRKQATHGVRQDTQTLNSILGNKQWGEGISCLAFPEIWTLLTSPVEQQAQDPIPQSISGFRRRKPGILGFLSPERCPLLTFPATGHTTIHLLHHSPSRSKGRCFSKISVFQGWKHESRFTHKGWQREGGLERQEHSQGVRSLLKGPYNPCQHYHSLHWIFPF